MKKIIYLLMIIPIIFASCEVEKMDDSYGLESTNGKGKIKASQAFEWADPSACSFSQTDLIAGQNMVVGTVTVTSDGINYTITYNVDAGYCLTETHLSVVEDPNDFPMTNSGNPKNGHFEYSDYYNCASNESFTVPVSKGSYIAAHGVVNCKSQSMETLHASLPASVNYCITGASNNIWNVTISGADFTGDYLAWCVDINSFLDKNDGCEDVDPTLLYSSLLDLPAGAFESPENFGAVNWLLNNIVLGVTESSENGLFTSADFQLALRQLVDEWPNYDDVGGDYNNDRIIELFDMAMANNDYVPGCDEYIGLILIPDGKQPIIFPYLIECQEGDCEETVWAKGCDFPGNNWAMYFKYE